VGRSPAGARRRTLTQETDPRGQPEHSGLSLQFGPVLAVPDDGQPEVQARADAGGHSLEVWSLVELGQGAHENELNPRRVVTGRARDSAESRLRQLDVREVSGEHPRRRRVSALKGAFRDVGGRAGSRALLAEQPREP
jgi:hypothetical protein